MLRVVVVLLSVVVLTTLGSSHSEAPGTAEGSPAADLSDFYAFRSPETNREDYVVFVANTNPLAQGLSGPNYYGMSPGHYVNIHIDNDGDAKEDLTLQFYGGANLGGPAGTFVEETDPCNPFERTVPPTPVPMNTGLEIEVHSLSGPPTPVRVPLKTLGAIGVDSATGLPKVQNLNWHPVYQLDWVAGEMTQANMNVASKVGRLPPDGFKVVDEPFFTPNFTSPFPYTGTKGFGVESDYEAYARAHTHFAYFPGCPRQGRVFVGPRKDSFSVSLGRVFDLINMTPLTSSITECERRNNELRDSNVMSFVVEIHKDCLNIPSNGAIAAWATVNELFHNGAGHALGRQVSRLGNPLVNELVIGLKDKKVFSRTPPSAGQDATFLDYVTHPTLPAIINVLFSLTPPNTPRLDLVTVFLTGLTGLNADGSTAEVLRLNTSTPITARGAQNSMGVIAGDNAGFPNGRRLGDDIVDIALRVVMGALCLANTGSPGALSGLGIECTPSDAPAGSAVNSLTDGSPQSDMDFDATFPFLRPPVPGTSVTYSTFSTDLAAVPPTPASFFELEACTGTDCPVTCTLTEDCGSIVNDAQPTPTPGGGAPTPVTSASTTLSASPLLTLLLSFALVLLLGVADSSERASSRAVRAFVVVALVVALVCGPVGVLASSHGEAPGTSQHPTSDISDFYMFRSYEAGRDQYVTFLINGNPLEKPFAGPNYYTWSDKFFVELNIDSDNDAEEDMVFQFAFDNKLGGNAPTPQDFAADICGGEDINSFDTRAEPAGLTLDINGTVNAVPLKAIGALAPGSLGALNFLESYSINYIAGDRDTGTSTPVTRAGDASTTSFTKAYTFAGEKTWSDGGTTPSPQLYDQYATSLIEDIDIPNCATPGRVWVGPRAESFSIPLGRVFDLINMIPLPGQAGSQVDDPANNALAGYNVETIALEVPISCLPGRDGVIGAWSTVRRRHASSQAGEQVSRLGNPLVNELFIGLIDKNTFSRAEPKDDGQFAQYVTHPAFPAIVDALFRGPLGLTSNIAPLAPRFDLVTAFLQGVPGLNQPTDAAGALLTSPTTAEFLRLNHTVATVASGVQTNTGVIGGDNAGFPNGRRPGDDVVDIALRVAMGRLCRSPLLLGCGSESTPAAEEATRAPVGDVDFLDGAPQNAGQFDDVFPYLKRPNPGAVNVPSPQDTAAC